MSGRLASLLARERESVRRLERLARTEKARRLIRLRVTPAPPTRRRTDG